MELGKRIYDLRVKSGLSQDKLAELLDVSRQSISKWENNLAIPDLDKIVKLSNIFDISLDELIKGEVVKTNDIDPNTTNHQHLFTKSQTIGMILLVVSLFIILVFTLVNALALGLLISIPLFVCSIICFVTKRYTGLWCAWILYLLFTIYIRLATGINTSLILYTFKYHHSMNYMRLWLAYGILAIEILLVGYSVKILIKNTLKNNDKTKFIACLLVFVSINVFKYFFPMTMLYKSILANIVSYSIIYTLCFAIIDYLNVLVFTHIIVYIIRYHKSKKHIASK